MSVVVLAVLVVLVLLCSFVESDRFISRSVEKDCPRFRARSRSRSRFTFRRREREREIEREREVVHLRVVEGEAGVVFVGAVVVVVSLSARQRRKED